MRSSSTFLLAVMLLGVVVDAAGTAPFPVGGIESGVKSISTYTTTAEIKQTYTDAKFTSATLYHGYSFSAINMPPQAAYYLMSSSSSASATEIKISLTFRTTTYRLLTISWIVTATAQPIFVSMQTITNPTANTQITVSDLPSFTQTLHAKVATLIAGIDYKPPAPSTALQVRVTPVISAISPAYNEYVTEVTSNRPAPFTAAKTFVAAVAVGANAVLASLQVAVVVHQVEVTDGVTPANILIDGGYYIAESVNSIKLIQTYNQLRNALPNLPEATAEYLLGFTQVVANDNIGLTVAQNLISTQVIAAQSQPSNSFDSAGFMYVTRNTIGTLQSHKISGCTASGCSSTTGTTAQTTTDLVATTIVKGTLPAVDSMDLTLTTAPPAGGSKYLVKGQVALTKQSTDTSVGNLVFDKALAGAIDVTIIGAQTKGIEGGFTEFGFIVTSNAANPILGAFKFSDANANAATNDKVGFILRDVQVFPVAAELLTQDGSLVATSNAACTSFTGVQYLEPLQCTLCVPPKSFDGTSCVCSNGFYSPMPGGTTCEPCLGTSCLTCSASTPDKCATCQTGVNRILVNGNCICESSYFDSNGVCLACKVECERCDVPNFCASCKTVYQGNFLTTNFQPVPLNGNCICKSGFYMTYQGALPYCTACSATCGKCIFLNNAAQCTSCKTGVVAIETGTVAPDGTKVVTCQCTAGNYLKADGTCGTCSYTCATCSGPLSSDCKTCPSTRTAKPVAGGTYTCDCVSPRVEQPNVKECVTVACSQGVPGCLTCTASQCLTCSGPDGFVQTASAGRCVCKPGFRLVGSTCQPCSPGCKSCDATGCTGGCIENAVLDGSTCKCVSKYYFDPIAIICKQCTVTDCTTCTADGACTACVAPKIPVQSQCVCPNGYYTVSNTEPIQCAACSSNCQFCTSAECSRCLPGFIKEGPVCVTACPVGKYLSAGVCENCPTGCTSCKDRSTCLTCQSSFFFYLNNCLASCPFGTLSNIATLPRTCTKCQYPCATCSGTVSTCTACLPDTGLLSGSTCQMTCGIGSLAVGNTCQPCAGQCLSCFGTPSNCTSCRSGLIQAGICVDSCSPQYFLWADRRICVLACPDGTYSQGRFCYACTPPCAACSGTATNCTRCVSNLYLSGNLCVGACPAGLIPYNSVNGGQCVTCYPECTQCSTPGFCLGCVDAGARLINGRCVICKSNTVLNVATGECQSCPRNCLTCSSPTVCSTCISIAVPVDGQCLTCVPPCLSCLNSPTECASCAPNFGLVGNRCVSSCPIAGQIIDNGICICQTGFLSNGQCVPQCPQFQGPDENFVCNACPVNCDTCPEDSNICTQCRDGTTLIDGKCTTSSSCPAGQIRMDGVCVRICLNRRLLYEDFCYDNCPLEAVPNPEQSACTRVSTATTITCPAGLFNVFGTCLSECPPSTFRFRDSCAPCSANCLNCLNQTYCIDCDKGTYLDKDRQCTVARQCPAPLISVGDSCVTACPTGSYSYGGICARTCDFGFYFHNGYCYQKCPQGLLNTEYGCVSTCPLGCQPVGTECSCQTGIGCDVGSYYDSGFRRCVRCQYPCSECNFGPTSCTKCASGILTQGMCVGADPVNQGTASGGTNTVVVGSAKTSSPISLSVGSSANQQGTTQQGTSRRSRNVRSSAGTARTEEDYSLTIQEAKSPSSTVYYIVFKWESSRKFFDIYMLATKVAGVKVSECQTTDPKFPRLEIMLTNRNARAPESFIFQQIQGPRSYSVLLSQFTTGTMQCNKVGSRRNAIVESG